jgi:DMSO/TMAO reductase YedYZ molybdopterin-dependent catalytic subunit
MSQFFTRRKLIKAGLSTAAGATGLGAAIHLAGKANLIPPDSGGILGISETLTYASQRLLTSGQPLAREFRREQISSVSPVNGPAPTDDDYRAMVSNGYRDWRLQIEGAVARPASFSLQDLKNMPSQSEIILHACEEGWSFIAEWTGLRLSSLLELVAPRESAKYVVFVPFANPSQSTGVVRVSLNGIGMADALHPQTLLAYGMNGEDLPLDHGAPIRLRTSRLLGYKNTKYISRIIVAEDSDWFRRGRNSWYGGI